MSMRKPRVDRRTFLRAAGAAATALLLEPGRSLGAAPRRNARKAVKLGMVEEPGLSLVQKFHLLRDLGFDGVELDSPNSLALEEVLQAREETGLEIPGVVDAVHWHEPLSDPSPEVRRRGREALERALRDCSDYGGSTVLLVPAVVNAAVSYAEAYTRSQEEIRRVLPLAQELGVAIAIENVWNQFLLSPLEAARYVDELGSDVVGWHLDVGNIVNYGWPVHWVEALGPRIRKLDVKEFSRTRRDQEGLWKGFDVELLEGDCDWPAVMAALDAVGYFRRSGGGWGTAEIPGGGRARLAAIAALMDRIFAS